VVPELVPPVLEPPVVPPALEPPVVPPALEPPVVPLDPDPPVTPPELDPLADEPPLELLVPVFVLLQAATNTTAKMKERCIEPTLPRESACSWHHTLVPRRERGKRQKLAICDAARASPEERAEGSAWDQRC
jgi:hypothetical protein